MIDIDIDIVRTLGSPTGAKMGHQITNKIGKIDKTSGKTTGKTKVNLLPVKLIKLVAKPLVKLRKNFCRKTDKTSGKTTGKTTGKAIGPATPLSTLSLFSGQNCSDTLLY